MLSLLAGRREVGDQVILTVCLVLTGAALSTLGSLPSAHLEVEVLGSPLGIDVTGRWLVAIVLVALCVAGTERLVRTLADLGPVPLRYTATFWILPALITLAAVTAVPRQADNPLGWLAVLALLGALLAIVLTAEYVSAFAQERAYRTARLVLNIATYGAAFALYASIYGLQLRGLLSAPAVGAVTVPLAVELLRGTEEQLESTWLYAAIVALLMAELTWAINWLGFSALAGGAALLLFLYAFGGVAQQHLAGRLSPAIVFEFIAIAVVGLGAIALSM